MAAVGNPILTLVAWALLLASEPPKADLPPSRSKPPWWFFIGEAMNVKRGLQNRLEPPDGGFP
jgi:hypothetical protein